MRRSLVLHPDTPCAAVSGIAVEAELRGARDLWLRYVVDGRIDDIMLPAAAAPARTDELWKHTCLEAFVQPLAGAGYYEFNFSPSSQWAAYAFDAYRAGMRNADIAAPLIGLEGGDDYFAVEVMLALPIGAPVRLGLTAVIEETSGAKSYWALAHAPGKPDFHAPDCFALQLPAANGP